MDAAVHNLQQTAAEFKTTYNAAGLHSITVFEEPLSLDGELFGHLCLKTPEANFQPMSVPMNPQGPNVQDGSLPLPHAHDALAVAHLLNSNSNPTTQWQGQCSQSAQIFPPIQALPAMSWPHGGWTTEVPMALPARASTDSTEEIANVICLETDVRLLALGLGLPDHHVETRYIPDSRLPLSQRKRILEHARLPCNRSKPAHARQ